MGASIHPLSDKVGAGPELLLEQSCNECALSVRRFNAHACAEVKKWQAK